MAVRPRQPPRQKPPYDSERLEQAALAYVGRYATTRAKLGDFLKRKLRERGWSGDSAPDVAALVERLAALGYVDDRAFALSRAASLGRRGYGARRVDDALRAAGIDEIDAAEAKDEARNEAWVAALRFAERRRIGPFAAIETDRLSREKAFAAMLRAGHPPDLARRLVGAHPGEIPEPDEG